MRLRDCLTITALLTASIVSAKASQPETAPDGFQPEAPRDSEMRSSAVGSNAMGNGERASVGELNAIEAAATVPSPLVIKDKVLGSAYFSTLSILSASNTCSDFFGGTAAAVEVFKQLVGKVRKEYLANAVGMTMSGEIVDIHNARTNRNYRLFSKVSINANGPFYRKRVSVSEPPLPRLGSFEANTKEVRVLIFLHELGHVMKGEDGNWLLPNDGKNDAISHQNSRKIEDVCGDQIKGLDHEGKTEAQTRFARSKDSVKNRE